MPNACEVIRSIGVLPVINIKKPEWAEPLVQILLRTDIPALEIVLRNEKALSILAEVKKNHPEMAIGAGTVLSVAQAEAAKAAGADFIVSPGYSQAIVDWCNKNGIPAVPGCTSASEIQSAYASGLRVVKFFPAEQLGGLKMIKQLAAPFSGMKFIPTNGMTLDNIGSYLKEDCIAACGGSFMAPAAELEKGDFAKIETLCRKAMENALGFSLAHVGINADGNEKNASAVAALCSRFFFPNDPLVIECVRENGRGTKGHIAIHANSVDRAVFYLKSKGVEFIPEASGKLPSGALKYIYLKDEVAGFAIHLMK